MHTARLLVVAALLLAAPAAFAATPLHHKSAPQIADDPPPVLIPTIKPVVLTYEAYVGGVHLLTVDILFEESGRSYHARVKGKTAGVLYKVFPWDTELNAAGQIQADRFKPVDYATRDAWGAKVKETRMHFTPGNITEEEVPPDTGDHSKDLTPQQKEGSLDPVTALLQMLAHVALTKDCNVTVPVFDGKRRFDVFGQDDGTEYIDEDDYGLYKGDTRTCEARFRQVAGEWTDKIKARFWKPAANGDDREPFHVWLASPAEGVPEVAVKIETESVWGDIMVHLTKWRYATEEDGLQQQMSAR